MNGYIEMAQELLSYASMETIVNYMDDEIREAVHADIAPCSDVEFLAEYMARHYVQFNEQFTI